MAVDYARTEETITIVRYEARVPLDASVDVHQLVMFARRELNQATDPDHPKGDDRDPGYGEMWIEPLGDTGDTGPHGNSRIAVCFRKVEKRRVDLD